MIFNHLDFDPPIELAQDRHMRWVIVDGRLKIALWGSEQFPRLQLTCQSVYIRAMPLAIPDRLFPGWNRPGTGFIRPGLDAMSQRRKD